GASPVSCVAAGVYQNPSSSRSSSLRTGNTFEPSSVPPTKNFLAKQPSVTWRAGGYMMWRRFVFTATPALFAIVVVAATARTQATGTPTPDPAAVRQAARDAGVDSLAHVAPPDVPNLDQFLNPGPAAMQAALILGQ